MVEIKDMDHLLLEKIISDHHTQLLNKYLNTNITKTHPTTPQDYLFYTDGSFKKSFQESSMGAAWIQVEGPNPGSSFQTGVANWPSAFHAEVTAITTLLFTLSKNSKATIKTDNKGCINTFKRLSSKDPRITHKRWLKENNWFLWAIILDLIKIKNLDITLEKVKAHDKDPHNHLIDKIAKAARNEPIINWSPHAIKNSKIIIIAQ